MLGSCGISGVVQKSSNPEQLPANPGMMALGQVDELLVLPGSGVLPSTTSGGSAAGAAAADDDDDTAEESWTMPKDTVIAQPEPGGSGTWCRNWGGGYASAVCLPDNPTLSAADTARWATTWLVGLVGWFVG